MIWPILLAYGLGVCAGIVICALCSAASDHRWPR